MTTKKTKQKHVITNLITGVSFFNRMQYHTCMPNMVRTNVPNPLQPLFKVKRLHCLFAICHTFTTVSNYHDKNPLALVGKRDLSATDRFSPFVC